MKSKKIAVLCLIMMQSWIAYSLHGTEDSTRLYSVPIWKVRRLVHDASLKAHCDSVNRALEIELTTTKYSLSNCDSLLTELTLSRDTWKFTSEQKDTILSNTKTIHDKEIKIIKRKKFIITLTAIGQAVVIVLLVI